MTRLQRLLKAGILFSNKLFQMMMIGERLDRCGCRVIHRKGDADVLIVQTVVTTATTVDTVLVGDDTDLLELLCHHGKGAKHDIYFKPEPKTHTKQRPRTWNIKTTRAILGDSICTNILFLNALLGCGTTSRFHGIGKRTALSHMNSVVFVNKHRISQPPTLTEIKSSLQEQCQCTMDARKRW